MCLWLIKQLTETHTDTDLQTNFRKVPEASTCQPAPTFILSHFLATFWVRKREWATTRVHARKNYISWLLNERCTCAPDFLLQPIVFSSSVVFIGSMLRQTRLTRSSLTLVALKKFFHFMTAHSDEIKSSSLGNAVISNLWTLVHP